MEFDVITTRRCVLSKLQQADFSAASELFTNEQVRAYLGGSISKQNAYDKLHSWLNSDDIYVSVKLASTNDLIGIISVSKHHDIKIKELSYQFLPQYWKMGLAYESIYAIIEYLKNTSLFCELIAETQSKNINSCKLLEKLGFSPESTLFRFNAEQIIYKIILK